MSRHMERFFELCRETKRFNEARDCAVKAVALVCNVSYQTAWYALQAEGRRFRGGTSLDKTRRACERLGWVMEKMDLLTVRRAGARTMLTAGRARLFRQGRFLLGVSGHIAACIDGEVIDWSKGRRHRLSRVYTVRRVEPEEMTEDHGAYRQRPLFW